jgi:hypothetical protein
MPATILRVASQHKRGVDVPRIVGRLAGVPLRIGRGRGRGRATACYLGSGAACYLPEELARWRGHGFYEQMSNKSPHRANATNDRHQSRQPRTTDMTRLLLCAATILALTASANAQSGGGSGMMGGSYFGPSTGGCDWCSSVAPTVRYPYPSSMKKPMRPQRIKQPRR